MMRWRPDTCGCAIIQNPDGSYDSHEIICIVHQGLTPAELATVPSEHNSRKNLVDKIFRDNLTSLLTTTDSNGAIVYKNGITFNWSFTGVGNLRVLNVSITGVSLTNAQKNTIRNLCDTQFGAGKVVVG